MTLLDYFAAKAMQGMLDDYDNMNHRGDDYMNNQHFKYIACASYRIAAAMLKERQKHIS